MTDFNQFMQEFPDKAELDAAEEKVKKNIMLYINEKKTYFVFMYKKTIITSFLLSCFIGFFIGVMQNSVVYDDYTFYENEESIVFDEVSYPSLLIYNNIMEENYE